MTARALLGQPVELVVTHLGALGDGCAVYQGTPVYIPYSLPQEKLRVEIVAQTAQGMRGRMVEIITPSPARHRPDCQHFGQCGGCSLQHLSPDDYRAFKHAIAAQMVDRLGLGREVLKPLVEIGAGSRRRVEWKVAVHKGQVRLGYYAAHSHDIMDLAMCPLAQPALMHQHAAWRECFAALKKPSCIRSLKLGLYAQGVDALLTLRAPLKPADKDALRGFAAKQGLLRLCVQQEGEAAAQRLHGEAVTLRLGQVEVAVPEGAFLQASPAAQEAITQEVTAALQGMGRVADLYAGCGTYSFPLLAQGSHIVAYEGDAAMVTAIENACRRYGLETQCAAHARDLFLHPLPSSALQEFAAVVINPPRNGALPQIAQIAQSGVERVVMVSCNPATCERDAKLLLAQGYSLQSLTPIDQFYWSAHLELVAIFHKKP